MPARQRSTIAVLRPEPADAPRDGLPAGRPGELATQLLADDAASLVSRGPDGIVIAIDAGEGRNVFVVLGPRELRLDAQLDDEVAYDEEHGEEIDDPTANDAIHDAAEAVVRRLQAHTGWSVESEHLLGFERVDCPSCERACFEWQERCAACGAWLDATGDDATDDPTDDAAPPPDAEDLWAEAIVARLLEQELLELAAPWARARVCSRIAAALAWAELGPERLVDMLVDDAGVEEIHASDDELGRILDETRPR